MAGVGWAIAQAASFVLYHTGALTLYTARERRLHGDRCVVLFYHRVSDDDLLYRDIVVSSRTFRRHLEYLVAHGHEFLTLQEHQEYLAGSRRLRADSVLITFDDGYRDNYEIALPIMREVGAPATVFVCSGPIDSGKPLWWDRAEDAIRGLRASGVARIGEDPRIAQGLRPLIGQCLSASSGAVPGAVTRLIDNLKRQGPAVRDAALDALSERGDRVGPTDRMLTWDMVRRMAEEGVALGSHSVTHPDFSVLSADAARAEIAQSMEAIERHTGVAVTSFAYPYGKREAIGAQTPDVLRDCGIEWAYTTENGFDEPAPDPFLLHRDGMRDVPDYVLAARVSGIFEDPVVARVRRLLRRPGRKPAAGE